MKRSVRSDPSKDGGASAGAPGWGGGTRHGHYLQRSGPSRGFLTTGAGLWPAGLSGLNCGSLGGGGERGDSGRVGFVGGLLWFRSA